MCYDIVFGPSHERCYNILAAIADVNIQSEILLQVINAWNMPCVLTVHSSIGTHDTTQKIWHIEHALAKQMPTSGPLVPRILSNYWSRLRTNNKQNCLVTVCDQWRKQIFSELPRTETKSWGNVKGRAIRRRVSYNTRKLTGANKVNETHTHNHGLVDVDRANMNKQCIYYVQSNMYILLEQTHSEKTNALGATLVIIQNETVKPQITNEHAAPQNKTTSEVWKMQWRSESERHETRSETRRCRRNQREINRRCDRVYAPWS